MAYTTPTASELKTRYPAFAAVVDATVELWIAEGEGETTTWPDSDRSRAVVEYAAHKLAETGQGVGSVAQGVSSFKSGTFSTSLSDAQSSRTGFDATTYGREFLRLMRRNFGGPYLSWPPRV